MQVAVDHEPDVVGSNADLGEGRRQGPASRPVVGVDIGMAAHPGVHEQKAVRMIDHIAKARLDPPGAGRRLLGRPHEVAEVDPSHCEAGHGPSLSLGSDWRAVDQELVELYLRTDK
jgi:hypothetical protein